MLKKIFTHLRKHLRYHILFFLLLIILYLYGYCSFIDVKFDAKLLSSNDTLKATRTELLKHNANLITTLQERESWSTSSIVQEKDGIWQTRSIYIAIVSIIFAFVLGRDKDSRIYTIIIILIIMFYGIDIHLGDLLDRSTQNRSLTSLPLDSLINKPPIDKTWYALDYTERDKQFSKLHETRIARKILAIYNPDLPQIIYILPFLYFYLLLTEIITQKKVTKQINL